MSIGESKFICILLVGIIIFSGILVYKIKSEPKYDQQLYNEIYSEYEKILVQKENKENYVAKNVNNNTIYMVENSQGQKYRVAGEISIPKINIKYPIIYETTEEYLKIAPTKLFGPDINEVGNLCIVGHNYKNEQFFSRIKELDVNDKVYLTNNKGEKITYLVYDKYEVNEKDLSCTSQDTNGNIEVTLITCTTAKKKRLIIKCRVVNVNGDGSV